MSYIRFDLCLLVFLVLQRKVERGGGLLQKEGLHMRLVQKRAYSRPARHQNRRRRHPMGAIYQSMTAKASVPPSTIHNAPSDGHTGSPPRQMAGKDLSECLVSSFVISFSPFRDKIGFTSRTVMERG